MEFTIKRSIFLNGIQRTLGIVERKTTMPILSHIPILRFTIREQAATRQPIMALRHTRESPKVSITWRLQIQAGINLSAVFRRA